MININKDDEFYKIEYYEILMFCKKMTEELIRSKTKRIKYENLKQKYSYFEPYFDFIFGENKYILNNPFYLENTIFESTLNKYFITKNNYVYNFNYSSDYCVGLNKTGIVEYGFFILQDGTLLDNRYAERHLMNAMTILNNYLIKDKYINKLFLKNKMDNYYMYNIIDFLIKEIGIIYGRKDGNKILDTTINKYEITKEQLNTINRLSKKYKINITNFEDLNRYNKKI